MKKKGILIFSITLFIIVSHSSLIPGEHDKKSLTKNQKEGASQILHQGPELAYQPTSIDFGNTYEGIQDNATFEIWNGCGCGTLEYTLTETSEWITVHPTHGTSEEEHDIITIDLDTTAMLLGDYTTSILIESNDYDVNFPVYVTIVERPNNPPEKPTIEGTTYGLIGGEYLFSGTANDPEEHKIYYNFSWGDGTFSGWIGPYTSGQAAMTVHSWESKGTYPVKVKARDEKGKEGEWSDSLSVSMPKIFHGSLIILLYEKISSMLETLQHYTVLLTPRFTHIETLIDKYSF